jgi:hypothetical protein
METTTEKMVGFDLQTAPISFSAFISSSSSSRRRNRRRRKNAFGNAQPLTATNRAEEAMSMFLLFCFCLVSLSTILTPIVVATSLSSSSARSIQRGRSNSFWKLAPPNENRIRNQSTTTITSSSSSTLLARRNAFLFSLLKRRRRRGGGGEDENDAPMSKKVVVAITTEMVEGKMKTKTNGAVMEHPSMGISPFYTLQSPPQFTSDEGNVHDAKQHKQENRASSSMLGAKRNARPTSEGVRFKSQLREGLEEKGKLHREQLLSNLLDGVLGVNGVNNVGDGEKTKSSKSNPRWWQGLVTRREKDRDNNNVDGETRMVESVDERKKNSEFNNDNVNNFLETSKNSSMDANNLGLVVNNSDKERKSDGNFAARLISGLVMALAEEVEGLDVKVDADADTPLWNKTVHSIKIYFSRLGFRQLRMGGYVSSEFDPSSIMALEKNALASSLLKSGGGGKSRRPTTASEAFDTIDVDKSGALDENELAQALKMAALIGGNKFVMRSKETLSELASRLVRLYDADGNGVVDRDEYQALVQDMASLRQARIQEELEEQTKDNMVPLRRDRGVEKKIGVWISSLFSGNDDEILSPSNNNHQSKNTSVGNVDDSVIDVTSSEEFWGSMDYGEGSIVLEGLKLDLRRLFFGIIPGVKRVSV